MNKVGDVIDAYGDCLRKKYPLGKAKLIEKSKSSGVIEYWFAEFVNEPGLIRDILIKKDNGESTT